MKRGQVLREIQGPELDNLVDRLLEPLPKPEEKQFSVKALAQRWSVSRSVVYAMVTDGRLPSIRIGVGRGTIRIKESDVIAFETDNRQDDSKAIAEHFGDNR